MIAPPRAKAWTSTEESTLHAAGRAPPGAALSSRLFSAIAKPPACAGTTLHSYYPPIMSAGEVETSNRRLIELLAPLPEDNDLSIPQENNLYFSRKQYVRNDKYTLANMLRKKDIELPSIMSAYRS